MKFRVISNFPSKNLFDVAYLAARVHCALAWQRRLSCQDEAYITFKVNRIESRLVPFHGVAVPVHKELDIIPLDRARAARPSTVLAWHRNWLLLAQEPVQWVCIWTVHVDLVVYIKLKPELFECPGTLLLRGAWRLTAKLVTGKCEEVKPVSLVLVVQCPQAWVVDILQGSLARNVDDDRHFPLVL
eukprot:353716-Chlamydomonas_euryale.AAC.5